MTLMFSSPLLQHTGKTCQGVIGRAVPGACTKSESDPGKVGDDPLDTLADLDLSALLEHAARHIELGQRQRRQCDLLVNIQKASWS